ncbi:hypothetical protein BDV26DRAFT_297222 [Aspergillus bertholletiae]|uniref:Apple domain-containing protein n=1 Tax=Aspergillus bertholletiae TaxID=1226010 RepID=A0A5N7AW94_9EURO|nr:hypothetical protein BDV26DRAFT_297222 [Aspergillus bertholletiae]
MKSTAIVILASAAFSVAQDPGQAPIGQVHMGSSTREPVPDAELGSHEYNKVCPNRHGEVETLETGHRFKYHCDSHLPAYELENTGWFDTVAQCSLWCAGQDGCSGSLWDSQTGACYWSSGSTLLPKAGFVYLEQLPLSQSCEEESDRARDECLAREQAWEIEKADLVKERDNAISRQAGLQSQVTQISKLRSEAIVKQSALQSQVNQLTNQLRICQANVPPICPGSGSQGKRINRAGKNWAIHCGEYINQPGRNWGVENLGKTSGSNLEACIDRCAQMSNCRTTYWQNGLCIHGSFGQAAERRQYNGCNAAWRV